MQSDMRRSSCLAIFRLLRIEDPDTVRIGEVRVRGLRENLLLWLQRQIYITFFCGMIPNAQHSSDSRASFVRDLSLANRGGHRQACDALTGQPGSYVACGPDSPRGTRWLRIYWNVSTRGAVMLTEMVTSTFHRLGVPFRLKVQLDTTVHRRDAAVLYLPLHVWPAAGLILDPACKRLRAAGDHLQPETPLFTKALRSGVGLAEDPQNGLSFGMHRSWLVALALVDSYSRGHVTADEQWSDLQAQFAKDDLSVDRAYLNAGSCDVYGL